MDDVNETNTYNDFDKNRHKNAATIDVMNMSNVNKTRNMNEDENTASTVTIKNYNDNANEVTDRT